MRHIKIYLFILLCCGLLPLTAYAENKKIIIPCAELTAIEIEPPPPGYPFPGEACGDKCFYIVFIMQDATAHRLNAKINAYKHSPRELYIGERLLGTLDPSHLDWPYSQKASTAAYSTLEEAVNDARAICPNEIISTPEIVRRWLR